MCKVVNNSSAFERNHDEISSQKLIHTLGSLYHEELSKNDKLYLESPIESRLNSFPLDAFDRDFCGRSCLYLAIKLQLSNHIIEMIYMANKAAFLSPDFCGFAPISLLFFDTCDIDLLNLMLDLCPQNFLNIIGQLESAWTQKIESLSAHYVSKTPSLMMQWKKYVQTVIKTNAYISLDQDSVSDCNQTIVHSLHLEEEAHALLYRHMCIHENQSSKLLLFGLKLYHSLRYQRPIENRLVHILSNYQSNTTNKKGDSTLEAIVLYRLWVSKDEAFHQDCFGRSSLHYLLKLNPTAHTLQAVYSANPKALSTPDFLGIHPISIPYLPVTSLNVLETLLRIQPDAFFKTDLTSQSHTSIMEELNRSWTELINTKSITIKALKRNIGIHEQWEKFMISIRYASLFHENYVDIMEGNEDILEVHAALKLWAKGLLSTQVVSIIMGIYSDQLVVEMDDSGTCILPLHYLLQKKSISTSSDLDFEKLLREILELFPESAIQKCSMDGRNALQKALSFNLDIDQGISDILEKFPEAIMAVDPQSNLSPFLQAAASASCNNTTCNLTTVYELLLMAPSAIQEKY
jgi:hypothetical protein